MTPDRLTRLISSVLLLCGPPAILAVDACGGAVGGGQAGAGGSTGSGPTAGPTGTGGSTSTTTTNGVGGDDPPGTTTVTIGSGGFAGSAGKAGSGGFGGWTVTTTTTGQGGTAGNAGSAGSAGSGGTGGNDPCVIPGVRRCYTPDDGLIPDYCVGWDAGARDIDAGGGSMLPPYICNHVCGQLPFPQWAPSCSAIASNADKVWVRCVASCPGVGRRPPGLEEEATGAQLGEYFRSMAQLEAASVDAFRILRRELAGHRLPRRLDRAMRRAARDEVRHARAARALGRRFGGSYAPPTVKPVPVRTLEQIAVDNAVEGCVRETYGALVATYQASMAKDVTVRAAMKGIAKDEICHAALSWQLDGWLATRLDSKARSRVASAKEAARAELAATIGRGQTRELTEVAGLPPPPQARALLDNLSRALG